MPPVVKVRLQELPTQIAIHPTTLVARELLLVTHSRCHARAETSE